MNGVALAVALASLGVDYSYRTTEEGQIEYTIQIEPEFLKSLAEGEEIHSDVPPDAGQVQRICVRIGTTPVKHTAASIQQYKRLLVAAPRFASTDPALASGDAQRTILWPARSNPEQSFAVDYGWQPDQQGQLAYYMQIDTTMLKTLAAGDEIHAAIDPAVGQVGQFVVLAGNKRLPRVTPPPSEPAVTPRPIAKSGARFQTGDDVGPQPLATLPPAETNRTREYNPRPTASPPAAISDDSNFGTGASRFNTSREPAPPDLRAPALAPSNDGYTGGGTLLEAPRNEYQQPPASRPPATFPAAQQPAYDPQAYNAPAPAPAPASRFDQYRTAGIQPPPAPPYQQPQYEDPTTRYSPQVASDRFASVPQTTTTAATIPPGAAAPEPLATATSLTTPLAKDQWWWPYWLFLIFSLFLSIGGNLYLGWTAAEFYSRYRLAVDRLRTAGRT